MRRIVLGATGAAALAAIVGSIGSASAQVYPSRPITVVVPFPAGAVTDSLARVIAEHLRGSLGQPIIIENVTGASGSIGTGRVARAANDGHTVVFGALGTHVVNAATLSLQYDVVKDFEPVALLASQPLLIVGRKNLPAKDLRELIAWLKENPDRATQGTVGPGSLIHLAGVAFQGTTGTRFGFVPYRGSNLAMQDLVAGHIDIMFDPAANSLQQVNSGAIKVYAVAAKARLAGSPDIPTVDEAGLPGFHKSIWFALWAPKGTPSAIVIKLNAAIVGALADRSTSARLGDIGLEIFPRELQTPEALAAFHKAETERWWPIIKAANVSSK